MNIAEYFESVKDRILTDSFVIDFKGEENALIELGDTYSNLGKYSKSIECCEEAMRIIEEFNSQGDKAWALSIMGANYFELGEMELYVKCFREAVEISEKILQPSIQNSTRCNLAGAYLFQNDLFNARTTIEAALQYDMQGNDYSGNALHGIIALRQGDEVAARGAFVRAIGQADEILSKTAEYYSALDAKGLALCGLALCDRDDGRQTTDDGQQTADGGRSSVVYRQQAIETFRKARKIAPHAGIVKATLRLFDELTKCDLEGILKDVRKAAEGVE